MVRRSTWIVLAIFAVLVGFAWFFQRYQAKKAEITPTVVPTTALTDLYNLTGKQVSEIKISDSSGNQISFYRDPVTLKWVVADVPADKVDSVKIESVSAQLFALQAQEYLDPSLSLASVGLVIPTYTITMTTTDGGQLVTLVGNQTSIGTGYYVSINSGSVIIVDKVVMDSILDLLINPPLLPTPTPEVSPTPEVTSTQEMTATETLAPTETGIPATPTP
jgi:Domain of unknown function (DUF4340)